MGNFEAYSWQNGTIESYWTDDFWFQLRKLDEVIKKTDQLLYQMIPKAVAERLRFKALSLST